MKIQINQDSKFSETEVTINCSRIDKDIEKMISMIRIMDFKLMGTKDNQTFILNAADVLYIDIADKRTFLYTDHDVYESNLKLYEIEAQLEIADFIRANKSAVINLSKVKSIKADIDGKLLVTMDNKEKVIISRQYAPILKEKLGVK